MNEHHGELQHFDPDQAKLDAFLARANFPYGWLNLESWARVMVHRAIYELAIKDQEIAQLKEDVKFWQQNVIDLSR